jgi:hypothetical protein
MEHWIHEHFEHVLFVAVLISRIGDIGTTYLVTPNLTLEANPIVRKFGWPYAFLTLLVAFVAYWDAGIAIIFLVTSLLVCAWNSSQILTAKLFGEEGVGAMKMRMLLQLGFRRFFLYILLRMFFYAFIGGIIMFFYPSPDDWGFYIAMGFFAFVFAVLFHTGIASWKMFRRA